MRWWRARHPSRDNPISCLLLSFDNNLALWLRSEKFQMNQIKRKIKKKSSPQQALKSKRFVVVTSCRQFEDLTYTSRLGYQTVL